MKMEEKKKKTGFFLKDKPYRRVTSELYQLQTQGGTNIVIRRRRGNKKGEFVSRNMLRHR